MAGNVAGIAEIILAIPAYSFGRVFVREFFHQFKVVKVLTGEGRFCLSLLGTK